ncbi:MAG: HYR domain-containing protein, partial [Flavobacteriales bacterium]|nr:HYR domain-containing protein [Flavobacteriales bacterium]
MRVYHNVFKSGKFFVMGIMLVTGLLVSTQSSSQVIWDQSANTGYNNAIAGIFRDDCSGLHQKKSKSEESTGIITFAHTASGGSIASPDNLTADLSSMLWGNNNATTDLDATYNGAANSRSNRIWKIQEEGTVGNVTLEVLISDLPAGVNYLLQSSTAAFNTGTTTALLLSDDGTYLTRELDLSDGEFFTFYKNTTPTIDIADISGPESSNQTFTVTLSNTTILAVGVNYATSNNTASAGDDYTAITSTALNIPAGSTSGTFTVTVTDDAIDENSETYYADLSSPTNATFAAGGDQAIGTITDNDSPPEVSVIASANVAEEIGVGFYQVTISLNAASGLDVDVNYATADGTANAGSDYTSTSGTATITAGSTTTTINIPITNDGNDELNETLTFTLSSPVNATLGTSVLTLTIIDDDAPPAICQDVTVTLDGAGNGSTTATAVNNGSEVNGTVAVPAGLSLDITSFDCSDLGANAVTLTTTDNNGDTNTCAATVTVQDTTNPTITCVGNQTANTDDDGTGNCSTTVGGLTPTATGDNCAVTLQTWALTGATTASSPATGINDASGQAFNVGVTTVTYIVEDASGNSATCNFTVTISDNEDPTISCVANQAKNIDGGTCTYTAVGTEFNPTAFADNCPGSSISNDFNASATLAGAVFPLGTTTVVWTVTDGSSNTATCSFDVVVSDNEDPTISCVANQAKNIDGGTCTYTAVGTEFNPTAFADNWPGSSISNDFNASSTLAGAVFPLGTTTVVWTVTDGSSNTATCS